jgi:hypothetical protein
MKAANALEFEYNTAWVARIMITMTTGVSSINHDDKPVWLRSIRVH